MINKTSITKDQITNQVLNAIENLSHAVASTNKLDEWKRGESEPYLLEAAKELVELVYGMPHE
jgi:HEPN domain-containing protein